MDTGVPECLFCKIVSKQLNAKIIYEDHLLMAIEDINPVAPVHVLIIPREHIGSLNAVNEDQLHILGHIQVAASRIADQLGIAANGYRLVNNCGEWGGQTIYHLHYHLIGGVKLGWPPL